MAFRLPGPKLQTVRPSDSNCVSPTHPGAQVISLSSHEHWIQHLPVIPYPHPLHPVICIASLSPFPCWGHTMATRDACRRHYSPFSLDLRSVRTPSFDLVRAQAWPPIQPHPALCPILQTRAFLVHPLHPLPCTCSHLVPGFNLKPREAEGPSSWSWSNGSSRPW